MRFLLATLHAPTAAFGSIAVGDRRKTWKRPSRSAALGLLAASLGIDRSDEAAQQALQRGLFYAVRVDAPGEIFVDYHIVQAPQQKRRQQFATRREELRKGTLNAIASHREWLADSFFTLCFWQRPEATTDLEHLAAAMRQPRYVLYCGRKAGALGLPLRPEIVDAPDFMAALKQRVPNELECEIIDCLPTVEVGEPWIAFDGDAPSAPDISHMELRRDAVESYAQRRFQERAEGLVLRGADSAS